MSHIGYDTDRATCECGWSAEGVWALDEAAQHQREHPEHRLEVRARV